MEWMSELGLSQDKVLFVGDTVHDFDVAQAIGVDCVLLPSGHQERAKLEATSATVLDNLQALTRL